MYTLRNVANHEHVIALGKDLTKLIAVKLWNEQQYGIQSAIYDEAGDIVNRRTLHLHMYHVELKLRGR